MTDKYITKKCIRVEAQAIKYGLPTGNASAPKPHWEVREAATGAKVGAPFAGLREAEEACFELNQAR